MKNWPTKWISKISSDSLFISHSSIRSVNMGENHFLEIIGNTYEKSKIPLKNEKSRTSNKEVNDLGLVPGSFNFSLMPNIRCSQMFLGLCSLFLDEIEIFVKIFTFGIGLPVYTIIYIGVYPT